jgi:hypothetical protein
MEVCRVRSSLPIHHAWPQKENPRPRRRGQSNLRNLRHSLAYALYEDRAPKLQARFLVTPQQLVPRKHVLPTAPFKEITQNEENPPHSSLWSFFHRGHRQRTSRRARWTATSATRGRSRAPLRTSRLGLASWLPALGRSPLRLGSRSICWPTSSWSRMG